MHSCDDYRTDIHQDESGVSVQVTHLPTLLAMSGTCVGGAPDGDCDPQSCINDLTEICMAELVERIREL